MDRNGNSRTDPGKGWAIYVNLGVFLSIAAILYHRLDSGIWMQKSRGRYCDTEVVATEEEGKQEGPVARNPVIRYFSVFGGLENISLDSMRGRPSVTLEGFCSSGEKGCLGD